MPVASVCSDECGFKVGINGGDVKLRKHCSGVRDDSCIRWRRPKLRSLTLPTAEPMLVLRTVATRSWSRIRLFLKNSRLTKCGRSLRNRTSRPAKSMAQPKKARWSRSALVRAVEQIGSGKQTWATATLPCGGVESVRYEADGSSRKIREMSPNRRRVDVRPSD